ncbi:MAG: hypothetical protein DMG53_19930 [Acidobacteria bacterium]|nr:MAG: hypothetical protein DMG53_19930 [Acidobacteriota bacterium]PYU75215.1 MAG: hypothetical protein DMG52_08595 [Acidobacteriota bacterium]
MVFSLRLSIRQEMNVALRGKTTRDRAVAHGTESLPPATPGGILRDWDGQLAKTPLASLYHVLR